MARPKKTKTTTIFATNLKTVLDQRQLTLKMAAELMEVPYTTLVDWSNGAAPSDIEAIGRLCKKLGIDFSWLMLNEMHDVNLSRHAIEDFFEEQETQFEGLYKIKAVKLVRKKDGV